MVIVAVTLSMSLSAFFGLRTSMTVHQTIENLRSDVVYAQRSAMFLKRGANEKWIYGIGISFKDLNKTNDHKYSLFKWCSQYPSYRDYGTELFSNAYSRTLLVCNSTSSGISPIKSEIKLLGNNLISTVSPSSVNYIIFESITGVPHFYRADGSIDPATRVEIIMSMNKQAASLVLDENGSIYVNPNYKAPN